MIDRQAQPTSKRRPDFELSSTERKHLRGLAHSLRPVITVGKAGLTEALRAEADRTLDDHELIKVKLQGCDRDQRKVVAADLVASLDAHLAGLVGNIAVVYRRHADPERRRISLD